MIPNANNLSYMNETENLNEWIELFQSNELIEPEKTHFLSILENDPLLRREVLLDKELNSILSNGDLVELSKKLQQIKDKTDDNRKKWLPILIAASIVFLLTVGVLTLITKTSLFINSGNPHVARDSSEKKKDNYLSANFIAIPEFEILIGSTPRGPSFELQQPQSRVIISRGSDLVFQWTVPEVQDTVKIELFNNRGEKVFESLPFPGNRFALPTFFFNPGVYYWKIIIDEELISMGCMTLL
jgi:hypothetical protein